MQELQQVGGEGYGFFKASLGSSAALHHLAFKAGSSQLVACRCYLVSESTYLGGSGADIVQALPELLQYTVQVRPDGGSHGIALIGMVCRCMDPHASAGLSVGAQSGLDVALSMVVAHGCADGCTAGRRKGGDFRAALAAVKGLDQNVGHGIDILACPVSPGEYTALYSIGVCGGLKAAALEELGLHLGFHQSYRRIGGDALGIGALICRLGKGLGIIEAAQSGHDLIGLVPAGDWVAAGHGDGIHIVPVAGKYCQRAALYIAVAQGADSLLVPLARDGLCAYACYDAGFYKIDRKGGAHAHGAAGIPGGGRFCGIA